MPNQISALRFAPSPSGVAQPSQLVCSKVRRVIAPSANGPN